MRFFDFPAEHWKHLRTTNVIESPFATVRLRERATRGAGSRTKGLLMAFKLLDMAKQRWRRLDGAHLLPLVRAGVKFVDGVGQGPALPITQSTNTIKGSRLIMLGRSTTFDNYSKGYKTRFFSAADLVLMLEAAQRQGATHAAAPRRA